MPKAKKNLVDPSRVAPVIEQWDSTSWSGASPSSSWSSDDWSNYYYGFNPYTEVANRLGSFNGIGANGSDSYSGRLYMQYLEEALAEQSLRKDRYQQWYNSESSKSSRLSATGINPDLVGLSEASEFNGSELGSPQFGTGDRSFDQSMQIIGAVQSSIEQAMSLASGISSITNNTLSGQGLAIDNATGMIDLAEYGYNSFKGRQPYSSVIDAQNFFPGTGIRNRKLRQQYIGAASQVTQNYGAQSHRSQSRATALNDAVVEAGTSTAINGRYDPNSISVFGDDGVLNPDFVRTQSEIAQTGYLIASYQSKVDKQQASNQLAYEEAINPTQAASAVNEQNKQVVSSAGYEKAKIDSKSNFTDFISSKIKENEGSPFAQIAWSMFGTIICGMLDNGVKLPSVSYSSLIGGKSGDKKSFSIK